LKGGHDGAESDGAVAQEAAGSEGGTAPVVGREQRRREVAFKPR
jgi:hypothetical protein